MGANATHCKKIKKDDGLVTFEQNAQDILIRYKALSSWPGIFLESGLKLLDIEFVPNNNNATSPIGVIQEITHTGFIVACKQNSLLLKTLQPVSKNAMNAQDYIRGKRLSIGDSLV